MAKEVLLTQEGYDALVAELEVLKTEKWQEVVEQIKVAKGFGDLSENSEYDEAKNAQGLLAQQIQEMEYNIKNARIVSKDELLSSGINVGAHVTVVDVDGDEEEYDIVGITEFDPFNNKISVDSPIGAALVGHVAGEEVSFTLPNGMVSKLTIKAVD